MRIIVVGAGVVGLSCAVRLLEAGHRVDVVARDLPRETTSAVAAAIWYPYRALPQDHAPAFGVMLLFLIPRHAHRDDTSTVADALTGVNACFRTHPHQREQMPQRGGVEDAKGPVERLPYCAEYRSAKRERPAPAAQLCERPASFVAPPDDFLGQLHSHASAHHGGQRANEGALPGLVIP